MKRLLIINDSFENKISYYLLAGFLVALPFDHFYSEWLLIIFCLHTCLYVRKERLQNVFNKNILIVCSVFLLSVLGIAFSSYRQPGVEDAVQQLALMLLPVFLTLTNLDLDKYKWPLLELFGITCTVIILYLYFQVYKSIRYFGLPISSVFSKAFLNQNFTSPVGVHATYFAMYVLLSVCIFLFLYYRNATPGRSMYLLFTIILFAGLIQLSSRAPFIAATIIVMFIIPAFLLQGRSRLTFLLTAAIVSVSLFLIIDNVHSLKKRYVDDLENDLSDYQDPGDLTESRLMRWNLEWQLVEKSPVIGYGTGSEEYILKEKYFDNKFYRSFLLGLNAHNQYLSFLLNTGFVGLVLYLFILYSAIKVAFKSNDFLLMSFVTALIIVSLSENILDVSKGVLFYSFFFSLFLLTGARDSLRIVHRNESSLAT